MRSTINYSKCGFTLIEMSVVLLIIGLLVAPAIGVYDIYRTNQRIEQTDFSMQRSSDAIGGFLAAYGRYPCPASTTDVSGSINYGYENCAGGAGITTVDSLNNTTLTSANNDILIGSIPFRTLNLQESETHDGYGNRLTYAVTQVLTNGATYSAQLGGISIIDDADVTLITPPHSGHFVIVTHGDRSDGATDFGGSVIGACGNAPTLDQENCNNNSVFRHSAKNSNFDDEIRYSSGIGEYAWQYQNNTQRHIHLKTGSGNLVAGATNLTNESFALGSANNPVGLELRNNFNSTTHPGTGILSASNIETPSVDPNTGGIITDSVCDTSSTPNCFNPRIIGGNGNATTGLLDPSSPEIPGSIAAMPLARYGKRYLDNPATTTTVEGGNIYCDQGALIGVQNGRAVCADNLTFACPTGQYVVGIGSNGTLRCSAFTTSCPQQTVRGFCGNDVTLLGVAGGARSAAYSGTCFMISGFDPAIAATHTTLASLNGYLNTLNSNPSRRTRTACPASSTNNAANRNNSMIRETYVCDGTTFDLTTRLVRKRGNYGASWSSNLAQTTNANNTGPAYPESLPMSVDANNSATNHDCWCREDYFAISAACTSGGQRFQVYKYRCPNTTTYNDAANRELVWDSDANMATSLCNCRSGGFPEDGRACYLHFGQDTDEGVTGSVVNRFLRNCTTHEVTPDDPAHDISGCLCPNRGEGIQSTTTDCPAGTGNSFTFENITYTNKSSVTHRVWHCPNGVGRNVTSAAQVGRWITTSPASIPDCTCVDGTRGSVSGTCGTAQTGTPPIYQTELNCSSGEYVRTGVTLDHGTCRSCTWQPPAATPAGMDINMSAVSAYSTCDCNSSVSTLRCKLLSGAYWNACQCRT